MNLEPKVLKMTINDENHNELINALGEITHALYGIDNVLEKKLLSIEQDMGCIIEKLENIDTRIFTIREAIDNKKLK